MYQCLIDHKLKNYSRYLHNSYCVALVLSSTLHTKIIEIFAAATYYESKYRGWVDLCSAMCHTYPWIPMFPARPCVTLTHGYPCPLHNWPWSLQLLGQPDTAAELAVTTLTYMTCCTQTSENRIKQRPVIIHSLNTSSWYTSVTVQWILQSSTNS